MIHEYTIEYMNIHLTMNIYLTMNINFHGEVYIQIHMANYILAKNMYVLSDHTYSYIPGYFN